MRKIPFVNNEFYHIYNRGVEKRNIFSSEYDVNRFIQSMKEFNTIEPIGSIYENSFKKEKLLGRPTSKLVEVVCYCLNPNHFHFLLEQAADNGISEFMKRLGGGYTKFFNEKKKRSGVLFQGRFKSAHINTNEYLLHLSVYINLNDSVHRQLGRPTSKLIRSSWKEYSGTFKTDFCKKEIILEQFGSKQEYKKFSQDVLGGILERRKNDKDFETIFIEP